jgi:hypothetical protein
MRVAGFAAATVDGIPEGLGASSVSALPCDIASQYRASALWAPVTG